MKTLCTYTLGMASLFSLSLQCWAQPEEALTTEEVFIAGEKNTPVNTVEDISSALKKQSVDFYFGGGAAKVPVVRGMNGDRVRVLVDGAETTAACANHMNPPLTYIDSSRVSESNVIAGITSVSVGGDSIAGTIVLQSEQPHYTSEPNKTQTSGAISLKYRSNADNTLLGVNLGHASHNTSIAYSGTLDKAESYEDGNGEKVLDTLYKSQSHNLTLGVKGEQQHLIVKYSHHEVPYQGFPNQYMDMVDNTSDGINIRYLRDFTWGELDTRVTWQEVSHEMGFFTEEKTGMMPMLTEGTDTGFSLKATLPISDAHTLKLGHEYHGFSLDDWWPPVEGSMMMSPDTYVNINDGSKERIALWAESDIQLSPAWWTTAGIRYEHVTTDAGDVQAYNSMSSMMMANPDADAAVAFNSQDREQTDNNIDLTLLSRFQPSETYSVEFGLAQKTRSPNLYERYSWGRSNMAMTMLGWFGDGNGYVGEIDLKPEIARTLSATANWFSAETLPGGDDNAWQVSLSTYYTAVADYINVEKVGEFNPRMSMTVTRNTLHFVNNDATLYGIDVNADLALWQNTAWGSGAFKTKVSYIRGESDDGGDLYQIMPLNIVASLEQGLNNWRNLVEVEWVSKKNKVDALRLENSSDAYTLVNLATHYTLQAITLSLEVNNLLDEYYEMPLGGVNIAQWRADGQTGQYDNIPGRGRSVDIGLIYRF